MLKSVISICLSLIIVLLADVVKAQEGVSSEGYNEQSLDPIHSSNMLYRETIWRRMDLTEKQNLPFFAKSHEVTRIIIEAVKNGTLKPYESDSLRRRMSKEDFLDNLEVPNSGGGDSDFGGDDGGFGGNGGGWGEDNAGDGGGNNEEQQQNERVLFQPKDVSILELKEDVIFDNQRSRRYYKLHSIQLILPPEKFPSKGLEQVVGTFAYKDLHRLFKNHPKEAIWVNPQNTSEHRNFADAFKLRLFSSRIVKFSNPEDERIIDMADNNRRKALLKAQEKEYELMEKEHELWSY